MENKLAFLGGTPIRTTPFGSGKRYGEAELAEVRDCFEHGSLIYWGGYKIGQFCETVKNYFGVKYCAGCSSGSAALHAAVGAGLIEPGYEVITSPITDIGSLIGVLYQNLIPVFADVDPHTYNITAETIEKVLTDRTRAIIVVHLAGTPCDMDPIVELARRRNLLLIEDCAQAHGAEYKGRKAGSMGDISTTSFYPTKILGGYGDGGMVNTNDEALAQRLRRLRFYGAETTYYANEHGYNSRLDELQAALLLTKLPKIEQYIHRRREIATLYQEGLADTGLILPKEASYGRHAYYLYVVRHPKRDEIIKKLRENNIHVNISYPWPIHTMKAYEYLSWKTGDLPQTECAAKEIFSLPMYPSLTNEELARVVEVIRQLF